MNKPDEMGDSLRQFARLADEILTSGLVASDALAALSAVGHDPQDTDALEFLDAHLASHRILKALCPDPFAPRPMLGELDGPFRIGHVADQEANPVALTEEDLNQNVVIAGASGSGKTQTIIHLMESIIETDNNVIFRAYTKKDDLPGMAELHPRRMNVFDDDTPYNHTALLDESPLTHPLAISRLLLHGEDVLPGTVDFLADSISSLYWQYGVIDGSKKYPVWREIYNHISTVKPTDNMTKYYRTVLRAKIRSIMYAFGRAIDYRIGLDLRCTMDNNTVFVQRKILPPSIRRFHILEHLTRLFNSRRRCSFEEIAKMPLVVCIIDDASEIFDAGLEKKGDLPPVFELVTMARQYRIAFVCAVQIPELLGRAIWDNHGMTICFRLPSWESRKKVGEVMG